MLIECPNCGSTAQVKQSFESVNIKNNKYYREYKCGCGCHFSEYSEIKILKKPIDKLHEV